MGSVSSTDPKPNDSISQSPTTQTPSEKLGDSSPPTKPENSEKLGDSSTVTNDPVEEPTSGDAEGEEEGECGFCLFMKAGGCKDTFTSWEVCVEEAEKSKEDIVTKCMDVTSALKKCMDEHSDYYQPILAAEKAAEEMVKKELEAENKIAQEDKNKEVVEEKKEAEA